MSSSSVLSATTSAFSTPTLVTSAQGTLSSAGLGSGLDVSSIVSQLVAIESQPLTQLQAQASTMQTQLSTWGQISSSMSTLQSAASALIQPDTWSAASATSSNSSAVNVTTGAGATAGNYSVTVSALASSQTIASSQFSSASSTVGSGTLSIQLGTWNSNQTSFTPTSGSNAVSISVASTDSLSQIASNINAANAGVTASVVTDANGSRLLLSGATGAANGFTVTVNDSNSSDTATSGLNALAFNPASGQNSMSQTQTAANAQATVNGLSVSSASNALTAINGLTMQLSQVTSTPVSVAVSQDDTSITTAINSFVSAFNSLSSSMQTDTAYNASTAVAGPLQGDSTADLLENQLATMAGGSTSASSVYSTLASIGITLQSDGTLAVNATQLSTALSTDPQEVQNLFATAGSSAGNSGIAQTFFSMTTAAIGYNGEITNAQSGVQSLINNNSQQQSDLQTQISAYQTQIQAQYSALDTTMASMTALSSYMTQQITQMDNNPIL